MSAPALTIAGKEWPLKWSLLAQCRLQSLPSVPTFADLSGPRSVLAGVQFAWAMLPKAAPFASPDTLAEALDAEADAVEKLDAALGAALIAAFPPDEKEAEAKKDSTGSSPAPASSSG
jgi:hypothetical protein